MIFKACPRDSSMIETGITAFGFVHGYGHGAEIPAPPLPARCAPGFPRCHCSTALHGWTLTGGVVIALSGVRMMS